MRFFLLPCAVGTLATLGLVALGACSGKTTTLESPADGGGSSESSTDGTTPGPDVQAPSTDAGEPDAAGEDAEDRRDGAAKCSSFATRAVCVECCAARSPAGVMTLNAAINGCACQPDLCGPLDAGHASDGGLGTGACADECKNGGKVGDPCTECRDVTLATDGGVCYSSVKAACEQAPACVTYVECMDTCPAK
jgi:hypothetical protein